MAYTYFENEQDFYATDMDDRITNSDVANMIADEARTSQLIAVDADEARTSQLIGDLCNTYYDTAFRAHNISNISAGIKQLLIGKIRFSSDGDWYTCLWDDGANVHLVDSRVAEKENLEKMGTETHIVKGVGGNQQVTPLASPINVDFETTVKSQPYSDMLVCKTRTNSMALYHRPLLLFTLHLPYSLARSLDSRNTNLSFFYITLP